jgi:hypothetical protein
MLRPTHPDEEAQDQELQGKDRGLSKTWGTRADANMAEQPHTTSVEPRLAYGDHDLDWASKLTKTRPTEKP